nr:MAG TPA: hypothetical protein [Caudoviricetes sp.]
MQLWDMTRLNLVRKKPKLWDMYLVALAIHSDHVMREDKNGQYAA